MNGKSNYKQSGVDWIGEIPDDWDTKKIRYIFWERKEINNPIKSDNLISLTIDRGVIPHSEKGSGGNKPKEDITNYKLVYSGDIVVNSMNVIVGAVGLSQYFGIVSPVYYMLVPRCKDDNLQFFHHLFRCSIFQKSLIGLGNGILVKQSDNSDKMNTIRLRIPMDKLNNQSIPLPPPNTQKLISQYLDKKTEQIDALIEKTQRKIDLLKEQQTATINHYVTKGLDPTVKMKDSGIEWIGEIPEHWQITKLKYQSVNGVQYGLNIESESYQDAGIRFMRITDINQDGTIKDEGVYLKSEDIPQEYLLREGDILFSRSGATVGKSCLIPSMNEPMSFAGYLVRFSFQNKDQSRFIKWVTESQCYWAWINLQIIQSTIQNVNGEKYANFSFSLPPTSEMLAISAVLEQLNERFSRSKSLNNKRIELLKEYRQSLISNVVTGKVRVTEAML